MNEKIIIILPCGEDCIEEHCNGNYCPTYDPHEKEFDRKDLPFYLDEF